VRFVERPVVKDFLVNGARRNEDEPACACRTGCFDQLERAEHVFLDEFNQVPLGAAKTPARPIKCGMNHRIAIGNQSSKGCLVAQFAGRPFHLGFAPLESTSVAIPAIPAAQLSATLD
jgi:hypothetical protein